MVQLLKLCVGLAIIVIQVFIGARAFFPEAFSDDPDALEELLDKKKSVIDQLAPEELAFIASNPVINVGVDPNFYPLEMFDERGRYSGLGSDYLRLLHKMTGLEFRVDRQPDWAAAEKLAREGKIDVFMAAASTGRRNDFMLFTAPYINLPGIIMTRRGSGLDQVDMETLKGKKVAVTQDYSWHDFLKEFHPEIEIVSAPSTLDALRLVADGEADAILDYEFNLMEKIQAAGILQMQTAGQVASSYGHAVASRKDRPELFNILTLAMSQITPQEKQRLAQKWLLTDRPDGEEKHLQWIFFFFVESILLCLLLQWYMSAVVRREVKRHVLAYMARGN